MFSVFSVGLLKQLLVQQLGFAEKGTPEDRQRFPRFRTVSREAQTESGSDPGPQHSDNNQFHRNSADRTLPSPGMSESTAPYGLRTSAEAAPGDAVLGATEPSSSSSLAIGRVSVNLEISAAELEGVGADESGERFFDAREAHSDENPSESELMERKEEEDVQIRISGGRVALIPLSRSCIRDFSFKQETLKKIAVRFPPLLTYYRTFKVHFQPLTVILALKRAVQACS